jgi:hypothetical protein
MEKMGLYDRDYMRADGAERKAPRTKPSLWSRFLFRLWLLFHPGRRSPK